MEVVEGCLDSRLAEFIVELRELREEIEVGKQERQALVEENRELKAYVLYLEHWRIQPVGLGGGQLV